MAKFLDDDGKKALTSAIKSIEGVSSAEVVVSVRVRSGSYLHTALLAAMFAAFAILAVLLYAEAAFDLHWFLLDPAFAAIFVGLVCHNLAPLQRLLTPASFRRKRVYEAAKAAFYTKGIRLTRARTGVLVYISIVERELAIICDAAVSRAMVDHPAWKAGLRTLHNEMNRGADAKKIASTLETLGPLLGEKLPRDEDDINELPDDIDEGRGG